MNNKILLSLISCAFFFSGLSYAGEIHLTGIKPGLDADQKVYELTINNAISIKGVKVVDPSGRACLKFPEYISRNKRVYPQVILITAKAKETLTAEVLNRAVEPAGDYATGYKITRFSIFKKKSNMKALASVSFNDALEIECKIIGGKNGPWVS